MKTLIRKIYKILRNLLTGRFQEAYVEVYRPYKSFMMKCRTFQNFVRERKATIDIIAEETFGKRVIVFPHTLDWNMALFQRPQQLAVSYSKKKDTVVLYLTKNQEQDAVLTAEKARPNLWVVNDRLLKPLWKKIHPKETIMSLSWTVNKKYFYKLRPDYLIYEFIDELEIFNCYGKDMVRDHKELAKKADVVVCTATKLYNQAKEYASNPILSTNAGDYDLFSTTASSGINPLIAEKIKGYNCVLGYYGALAKWFDYDMVREVALRKQDWLWVLIGMNYDKTLDKSRILDLDNVIYIPPQDYKVLPTFLKGFSIATIPFVINEITLSTSPVKLFEYMSAGKPILTSKMPECCHYKSVYTYCDIDDFLQKAEILLNMGKDDEYWETMREEAQSNTWDSKTDEILEALY